MCAYYFGNTFVYPEETARPLSDVSARRLPFSVCCTPLCFGHLFMAETALRTIPLFISLSVSPHTSQGANTARLLPNALPFHSNFTTLHMMETGMVFFVIIHLYDIVFL